jgi:hypothetical protein
MAAPNFRQMGGAVLANRPPAVGRSRSPAGGVFPPPAARASRPLSAVRRPSSQGGWRLTREQLALLLAALALGLFYLGLAAWLTFGLGLYNVEAMGRTVDAWQIFKQGNWDSVSFSFLLPPLLTLLAAPLHAIPWLRSEGFATNVVTVIAGVVAFLLLARILGRLGPPSTVRWILLAAYAANPLVWLYAANGAAAMLYLALVLGTVDQALYLVNRVALPQRHAMAGELDRYLPLQPIILLGFFAGFAALTRLSGLVVIGVWGVFVLGLALWLRTGGEGVQSVAILYLLPPLFAVGLWGLGAAMLAGNPLYPLFHLEEAAIRSGVGDPVLARELGVPYRDASLLDLATQFATLLLTTQPLAPALVALLVLFALRGDRAALVLTLAVAAPVLALLVAAPFRRAPFALFDLLTLVPLLLAAVGWLAARLARPIGGSRRLRSPQPLVTPLTLRLAVAAFALLSPVAAAAAMATAQEPGQWPREFLAALLTPAGPHADVWGAQREVARLAAPPGERVLLDDLLGYRFIFLNGHPERFVTRADRDFDLIVRAPVGAVTSVLVPMPGPGATLDRVGQVWPGLMSSGVEWAAPALSWPNLGWRLFRVVGGRPT